MNLDKSLWQYSICIVQYVKEKLCCERKEYCTQKNSLAENNDKEIEIQIIFILDDQREKKKPNTIKFFTPPPEARNPFLDSLQIPAI